MTRPPRTGYEWRILEAIKRGLPLEFPGASDVDVAHHDDCPILGGKSFCACVPNITIIPRGDGETYKVNPDGSFDRVVKQ